MEKIKARFIIQIAGKPIENVEKAITFVLDKLKEEKENFKVIEAHKEEAELDAGTTLYVSFIEVTVKFANAEKLLAFILDYTPTSIEVEDPSTIEMSNFDFTAILNDFSNNILGLLSENRKLKAHINIISKENKKD